MAANKYTIAWLCALTDELVAAKSMLDLEHDSRLGEVFNDPNKHTLGCIGRHNIVICCLPKGIYGTDAASSAVTIGIGGAVLSTRHDIRIGDVAVSVPGNGLGGVLQHDFGKHLEDRFLHTRSLNKPPAVLLNAVSEVAAHHLLSPLGPRVNPEAHYGLIDSGNQVIRNPAMRDWLAQIPDVICVEMEAAGVMDILPCLVIRGISDFADASKDDRWKRYAAATAAAYAKELLNEVPQQDVEISTLAGQLYLGSALPHMRAKLSLDENPNWRIYEAACFQQPPPIRR
ncbi:nucleoside phosphorylase domain-containing protein [Aspergillus spectabilis]